MLDAQVRPDCDLTRATETVAIAFRNFKGLRVMVVGVVHTVSSQDPFGSLGKQPTTMHANGDKIAQLLDKVRTCRRRAYVHRGGL